MKAKINNLWSIRNNLKAFIWNWKFKYNHLVDQGTIKWNNDLGSMGGYT